MDLLFDTHAFLWWELEPHKLTAAAREMCQSSQNRLVLSVASVWEIQIKLQIGKLELQRPLEEVIERQRRENAVQILPIEMSHVCELRNLPPRHKDPFDRLLISQARVEKLAILSADRVLSDYPVEIVW